MADDDVPAYDDIPSFDDLPDAPEQQTQGSGDAVPSYDDIPSFDDMPDGQSEPVSAEGHIAADTREIAHGAAPAAGGFVAAGYGARLGAAAGALAAPVTGGFSVPVGAALGAIAGFALGGMGISEIQERAARMLGYDDRAQRQANAEERPYETFAAGLAPGLAGMSLGKGVQLFQRLISGGALTAFEGAQEYMTDGHLDPIKLAMAAGAGAALPQPNRAGKALLGIGEHGAITGKQVTPPPDVPQAAEGFDPITGDSTAEVDPGGSPLAEAAGPGTGSQDAGQGGSPKTYAKKKRAPSKNAGVTTGDIRPDVEAAIQAAAPEEELPLQTGLEQAAVGAPMPTPRVGPRRVVEETAEASKQPGIMSPQEPDEGQQPGLGENVARPKTAEAAREPIGIKPEAIDTGAVPKFDDLPELPGKVATVREDVHPEPSDAQVNAENYKKGYPGRFAGKDVAIETAKGGIRRSKPGQPPWEVEMPTDYGHLLRTKGADGDPIDIHFGDGDKHFIIDQRDPATGKFDEHKIMSHVADEAQARELYAKGFSDGKGEQRLQAITPATEDEIKDWTNRLANMPAKRKQPYGKPEATRAAVETSKAVEVPKTELPAEPEKITATVNPQIGAEEPHPGGVLAKDRVAVRDMLQKLRDTGKGAEADAIEALPHAELMKYVETGVFPRRRAYAAPGKSGYPIADLKNSDGTPVTTNTKAKADQRTRSIGSIRQAFSEHPPAEKEADGDTLQRLRDALKRANDLNGGSDAVKTYKPTDAANRIEWSWLKHAKDTLQKPTPAAIEKFRDAERELRGGDKAALGFLQGKRITADIEKSRRSGDEAIGRAEAAQANEGGLNTEEDKILEAIDNKRKLITDTPHDEAEEMVKPQPVKTKADIKEPKNKQIDLTTDEGHDELSKLMERGKKLRLEKNKAEEQVNLDKGASAAEKAAAKARLDAAVKEGKVRKAEMTPEMKKAVEESLKRAEARTGDYGAKLKDSLIDFSKDERASFDIHKFMDDLKNSVKSFSKVHEADSYISKKSTGPADDYARSVDEQFHANRQQAKNDIIDHTDWAQKATEGGVDNKLGEKFYLLKEANKLNTLTPEEQAIYDKWIKHEAALSDAAWKEGHDLAPEKFGAEVKDHVTRILLNGEPNYDNVLRSGASDDPIEGRKNALSTSPKGPAKDRTFFALEDAAGKRWVISVNKNGYTLWDKYKGIRVKDPGFAFTEGAPYKVKNKTWTMKQALTPEIEQNARLEGGAIPRYNKDIRMSLVYSNVLLRGMVRDIKQVMDMKNSDEFKKFATKNSDLAKERSQDPTMVKNGEKYDKTVLPNFEEYWVHPDLRAVMDQFARPGFDGFDNVRAMSQAITKLLFWLPTAHINNVGAHWFVERGWDWVNPMGYRRLLPTAMRAIRSVWTQDHIQNVLRREGAGTIQGGVVTRDWMNKVGKLVGNEMEQNHAKWDPIAKTLGWGPSTLVKAWYDGSQRVMWAANDMFLTQAYLENMLKGHSMTGAIRTVERHIPNYRVPGKVITSGSKGRWMSQAITEPAAISFGRYHYEVFNSFAHIAKDIVHGDAKQKFDALGNIMAMGILGLGIYPILDEASKLLTGNEHATAHRRGPMAVGSLIHESTAGAKDPMAAPRSALTISPLAQTILEARGNKDFAGRNIIEPGAFSRAAGGSPSAMARVGGQGAEYLLKSLVSPYGTFANAYQTKEQGPAATVRDQALDLKNPSPRAIKGEGLAYKKSLQQDKSRFAHGGRGPFENLVGKVLGY